MHPLTFQFKRAHWSAVAFGTKLFRGTRPPEDPDFDGVLDMTPARFDILYLVHGPPHAWAKRGEIEMAELWRALGVSRATISRGIDRLVQLGLVVKKAWPGQRGKTVALTDEGFRRIRRALKLVFGRETFTRHFDAFFGRRRRAAAVLGRFWLMTLDVARHLGDRSQAVHVYKRSDHWLLAD